MTAVAAATAIGLPAASAEPVPMRPLSYDKVSRDGWQLNIRVENEVVNSIPNLANAQNSREGFVTASATATAVGGANPITDSIFILGYQLGCQSDVSAGLQYGVTGGGGPSGAVGIGGGSPVSASVGIDGGAAGFVQTVLQPGVIVDLPLSNMTLSPNGQAMIDIDNIHIKADACGGDVTIRSYAYLRISTDAAHTQFAIYGDPIKI
ncbi:MspA family porin [Mycolicibacterium sp. BiH015]|uniref:MspA family porin n=1 Tax=Mycolicibacterium sp. BiH015 TaxID=3018808 RepID=UPI0022E5E896|nr:MspA family porin [Mycolicibacterium sp. BiH015]MDA2894031.1 MspA family porin [Mycolicibacterium sp. BiH015]